MHTSHKGNHLYCIAAKVFRIREGFSIPMWSIETFYVHAKDVTHARLGWLKAHPNRRTHAVISVGLAIGFFHAGYDKSGSIVTDKLSADA